MKRCNGKIEDMAKAVAAFFPKLDWAEKRIALKLYRLLSEGKALASENLARAVGLPIETVDKILKAWPGVYCDEAGRIVGFWGLALNEMNHRFEIAGKRLYAWCAWDTLFLPQLIGKAAKVESACPLTGQKIRLTVTPDNILDLWPSETILSFVTPNASKVRENVVIHFCPYIHFFSSTSAGEKWISDKKATFLLSMKDAFRLGQLINRIRFESEIDSTF